MRVVVLTKIFPNALEPFSSPFNRQQFSALGRLCDVEVLATIPWFPGAGAFRRWSASGRLIGVPASETIDGLVVKHPRFLFVPKVGLALSGPLYVVSLARQMLNRRGKVDVVLGSWAYPDGFAAVVLAEMLSVPSVVKLHGSDMNIVATKPGARRHLRWALPRASRVLAVSRALAEQAANLGVAPERIEVVPNGVDTTLFHVGSRLEARAQLKLNRDERLIVYVGRLEHTKGVLDLLHAFNDLTQRRNNVRLALIGDGAARRECEAIAGSSVRLTGARPLSEIPSWMRACDVLTLPSWNEGTPNVLLEAQACGRPIVATDVGGIPDLVNTPSLGELVPPHDPAALAKALERALDRATAGDFDEDAIAKSGNRGGWNESAAALHVALERAIDSYATRSRE